MWTQSRDVCSAELPRRRRDPFDRLLVAQSADRRADLVTNDPEIVKYGVEALDAGN